MCNFKELTLSECTEEILKIKKPLVAMHVRPDGDTVGSGAALCQIFKALGRDPKYICADKIPERLAFLVEDLSVSDSVEGYEPIAIDVASPTQLGDLSDKLTFKLMIDHHEIGTPFAPYYTLKSESSAGEVLLGIALKLERLGKIRITEEIASPIYAAISSDTGGFVFSNATEKTYRAAADLIARGVDHAEINHKLFYSKSLNAIKAEGFVASKIEATPDGKIAYAVISQKDIAALEVDFSEFECAIDVVRSLVGVEIAFVIKETPKGEYKASLRSTGANVAEVAKKHLGGGHVRAAGCTIVADSPNDAAKILLEELTKTLNPKG